MYPKAITDNVSEQICSTASKEVHDSIYLHGYTDNPYPFDVDTSYPELPSVQFSSAKSTHSQTIEQDKKKIPLLPEEDHSHSKYGVFENSPMGILELPYTPNDLLTVDSPARHEYDWLHIVDAGSPFVGFFQPHDEILVGTTTADAQMASETPQTACILGTDMPETSSPNDKPASLGENVLRRSTRIPKLRVKQMDAPQLQEFVPRRKQPTQPKNTKRRRGLEDTFTLKDEEEDERLLLKKRKLVVDELEIGSQDFTGLDGDKRFMIILDDVLSEYISKDAIVPVNKGNVQQTKYMCPEATSEPPCHHLFKTSRELKRHWGSVHVATSTLLPEDDERRCELLKLLECPDCPRLLSRRDSLRRHVKQAACGKRAEFGPMRNLRIGEGKS